jgi:hypothetical protein
LVLSSINWWVCLAGSSCCQEQLWQCIGCSWGLEWCIAGLSRSIWVRAQPVHVL